MYVYKNNCNCLPIVKSQSVEVVGSALQITLPAGMTLLNGKQWRLVICQNIPNGGNLLPVQFVINGTTYPVYCRLANLLRGDMIRSRKSYIISYGWDVPHFIVLSCNLCESAFVPTTATTPTPTPANVVNSEQS